MHSEPISVAEAARRGIHDVVHAAELGTDVILTRAQDPVVAVVAYSRLAELEQAAADLRDLALVTARRHTDDGGQISFDDVLAAFGCDRSSLHELPDD